jgi:hypothetical protein
VVATEPAGAPAAGAPAGGVLVAAAVEGSLPVLLPPQPAASTMQMM